MGDLAFGGHPDRALVIGKLLPPPRMLLPLPTGPPDH